MSRVWFKFYGRDFRDGVRLMTPEQIGAYTLILTLIYESADGRVCDDDHAVANHAGIQLRHWRRLKQELLALGKLTQEEGFLTNARAKEEHNRASIVALKRRSSGSIGGLESGKARAKSQKTNENNEASASNLLLYARALPESRNQTPTETSSVGERAGARKRTRRKKPTFIASEITMPTAPNERMLADAAESGFVNGTAKNLFGRWRDYHLSHATEIADIEASFRTWIGNELRFRRPTTTQRAGERPAIYPNPYRG